MTDQQPAANPAEQAVLDHLTGLGISFSRFTHPPVFTVEEAERYWADIPATHCKNLFLRNAKGTRHYLVVLEHAKTANLKDLAARIGDDRLSFASPDRLQRFLGLTPGSVSPFGLIHPALGTSWSSWTRTWREPNVLGSIRTSIRLRLR